MTRPKVVMKCINQHPMAIKPRRPGVRYDDLIGAGPVKSVIAFLGGFDLFTIKE